MEIKRKYILMILAVVSSVWIYYGILVQKKTKYEDFINFSWMSGDWYMRTDEVTIHEHWDGISEHVMEGYSTTLNKDGDTLATESLRIIKIDGQHYYIAKAGSKKQPTTFEMVVDSIRKVSFYNPKNEFPQWITYQRLDDSMYATIKNTQKSIVFSFELE
jgi:hypothetical protein